MSEETKAICQEIAEGYKALAEEIYSALQAGDEPMLREIAAECAVLHSVARKEMRMVSGMEFMGMLMRLGYKTPGEEQKKEGAAQ